MLKKEKLEKKSEKSEEKVGEEIEEDKESEEKRILGTGVRVLRCSDVQ